MTVLYRANLPISDEDRATAWATADSLIRSWVKERFSIDVADNEPVARGRSRAEHRLRAGDAGRHATFATSKTDDAGWRWLTTVWVLDSPPAPLTVQARLEVRATGDANTALDRPIAVPRLVPALLDALDVRIDGFRLGRPHQLGADDLDGLVALLLDGERRLPVVIATPPASGPETRTDASDLASKLGGLAHVFDLGADATWGLSEQIGRDLGVFDGGVRIYWPGATVRDRPRVHPLWTRRAIEAIGFSQSGVSRFPPRVLRELAAASTLHDETPPLVLALQAEQRALERAATETRLAKMRAQVEQAAAAGGAGLDEAFFDQVTSEYDATIQTLTDERDDALDEARELREQVDQLRDDLEAQRRSWAMIGGTHAGAAAESDIDEIADVDEEARSIPDAVRIAAEQCDHLVFLSEAFASAVESSFPRPDEVLGQLRALDRVAARLFDPSETRAMRDLCPEEGLSNFRSGISTTAFNRYAADYERTYDGRTITLSEHLATGIGAPTAIMRIYFARDTETGKIVVGHVGRKLRDRSNR